jgi:LysM repeat protein
MIALLTWLTLILAGCASPEAPSSTAGATPRAGQLTPYTPLAPSQTLPVNGNTTPTPLPSLTPTPLTHVVSSGEDLFGIAYRYGVTLEILLTANPTVNPRAMSVGTVLIVPSGSRPTPTVQNPSPTPLPVTLGQAECFRALDGSLTCLAAVTNTTGAAVENLSGRVRLLVQPAGEMLELPAFPLLNLLQPGASLPLVAYLNAPAPEDFELGVELQTGLPLPEGDTRYLPAELEGVSVEIAPDGLSAVAQGSVALEGSDGEAGTVWVAAVAYAADGKMVGVRRWENAAPLAAGSSIPFNLAVYSLGGEIDRVDLLVEARR